jgi:hypothetical protein
MGGTVRRLWEGWALTISVSWVVWVLGFALLDGLAFGVAMARAHQPGLIFPGVVAVAVLAVITTLISLADAGLSPSGEDYGPVAGAVIGFVVLLVWLCLAWLVGVVVFSSLSGREENPGTGAVMLLLVASALGVGLGVALVKERRTMLILLAVPAVALLATVTSGKAYDSLPESARYLNELYWDLTYFLLVVVFGTPVILGAFVGRMWRLLVETARRKDEHR